MKCPKCNADCHRDEVDVGVGIQCGPYGCPNCGWSEWDEYNLSEGQSPLRDDGGAIDQYGGYHPARSLMARAYRLAENDPRIVRCEYCGSDYGGQYEDERESLGDCPVCEGTGRAVIETVPVEQDDLALIGGDDE